MSARAAATHTVRVSEQTHQALHDLSNKTGEPMTTILARAVERYQREFILEQANAAWTVILEDEAIQKEIQQEQEELDGTLADGLDSEPW